MCNVFRIFFFCPVFFFFIQFQVHGEREWRWKWCRWKNFPVNERILILLWKYLLFSLFQALCQLTRVFTFWILCMCSVCECVFVSFCNSLCIAAHFEYHIWTCANFAYNVLLCMHKNKSVFNDSICFPGLWICVGGGVGVGTRIWKREKPPLSSQWVCGVNTIRNPKMCTTKTSFRICHGKEHNHHKT